MSKNSQGRFPSVRLNCQRKESKELTTFSSTKEQLLHVENQNRFEHQAMSTMQNQVAKKIQSKLRMRKPTGSEKKLKQICVKDIDITPQFFPVSDLKQKISDLWQNSHQIFDIFSNTTTIISPNVIKQQLIKQSSLIMCQLAKGQDLENVIVERLKKKLSKIKCISKCEERQNNVKAMLDDRLQKLSVILRAR